MSLLKQKLLSGKLLIGTHVNLNDLVISEIMGGLGFDFLWIDTEHTAIDYQCLLGHLVASKASGTPAIVRVPWNNAVFVKRVLEMGPAGIVFPMINTAEEAEAAMQCCIYPPIGNRGFGPNRAIRYGIDDVGKYINSDSLEICRFVQVETKEAVSNLDEIARNPYIDAFIIGPYDLSGSVGQLGNVMKGETDRLIDIAIEKAHKAGKPIGVSTGDNDYAILKHWLDKGIDIISTGTEYLGIIQGARTSLNNIKKIVEEKS
jgi:4-hydroxy-2-oxoheptanedioate aldolase